VSVDIDAGSVSPEKPGTKRRYRLAPLSERLERKREIDPGTGCWLWTGWKNWAGYGRISNGKHVNLTVSRAAWIAYRGPIPAGVFVCHRCDVPACFNPDHLFLGHSADNMRDMVQKGRSAGPSAENRQKTHCHKGHPLDGANLKIEGARGARRCMQCRLDAKAGQVRRPSIADINRIKTHCKRGHLFVDPNIYYYRGARKCKTCTIDYQRARGWK
jgi:hypothetical protein